MKSFRNTLIVAGLGVSLMGAAHAVSINPDALMTDGNIQVGSLDWAVGNVLVTPTTVGGTVTVPVVGDVLQTYAHARLGSFLDTVGNPIGGLQLNGSTAATNYEWTYVAGFRETVNSVIGSTATFRTVAGGTNFFNIYYDPTPDAINVNGTGFGPDAVNPADSILILSGSVLAYNAITTVGQTSFTAGGVNASDPDLDNFVTDNYPTVDSITGTGGGQLAVSVNPATGGYVNAAYFPGGIPSVFFLSFDTQLNLAYSQTDPSSCFWNGATLISGVGPNTASGFECATNTVGAINGFPGSGANEVLMSDSSTSFAAPIPEPMTVALLGLGLGALGVSARRRRKA